MSPFDSFVAFFYSDDRWLMHLKNDLQSRNCKMRGAWIDEVLDIPCTSTQDGIYIISVPSLDARNLAENVATQFDGEIKYCLTIMDSWKLVRERLDAMAGERQHKYKGPYCGLKCPFYRPRYTCIRLGKAGSMLSRLSNEGYHPVRSKACLLLDGIEEE